MLLGDCNKCSTNGTNSCGLDLVGKQFPRTSQQSTVCRDSLDAIEVENGSHVFWQGHGVRPCKVICDRNYVLLTSQGRDDLLQDETNELEIIYLNFTPQWQQLPS